jgi:hypothetical protein
MVFLSSGGLPAPTVVGDIQDRVNADAVLHFTMPIHVEPRQHKRNVNYTMFEADRISKDWAIRAAATDLIVVPTESSLCNGSTGGFR